MLTWFYRVWLFGIVFCVGKIKASIAQAQGLRSISFWRNVHVAPFPVITLSSEMLMHWLIATLVARPVLPPWQIDVHQYQSLTFHKFVIQLRWTT